MTELRKDLLFGLRLLVRQPGFSAVALLTLALGIGAAAIIFSIVNGVLLRPLPFGRPEQLIHVSGLPSRESKEPQGVSLPDFWDYRQQATTVAGLAAYSFFPNRLIFSGQGEPVQVDGISVTANYFDVLGVQPLHGRTFREGEDQAGQAGVAVLSYGWWQRSFGGDPYVIGRKILLNSTTHEIIGVMPAQFDFPARTAVWIPVARGMRATLLRDNHSYLLIGRMRDGLAADAARAEIESIVARLELQYPATNAGFQVHLRTLRHHITGDIRPTLLLLSGCVGALLLIACGNIANLLLTRATGRRREIAVRRALGATRGRLIRQMLTESLLLAIAGGALGLLSCVWVISVLRRLDLPNVPRLRELSVDQSSLGFTALIVLATAVLFGLAPALQGTALALHEELKSGGAKGSTERFSRNKLRGGLVIGAIMTATVLLVGAGLLLESMRRLMKVDAGFAAVGVTVAELSLPVQKFHRMSLAARFVEGYLQRVRALPGVESAAATITPPLAGVYSLMEFSIDGEVPRAVKPAAGNVSVSAGFFETFRIPLRRGRLIEARDTREAPKVVVISEPMAKQFFPGQNPLGRKITLHYGAEWTGEIVGVTAGVRGQDLAEEPRTELYVPFAQMPYPTVNIIVRSSLPASRLAGVLKQELKQLDPDLPLNRIRPMDDVVADSVSTPRLRSFVTAFFAGAALLLASIGIYGVVAYSVSRRTAEMAVRLALGASRWDVIRLVLRQSLLLVGLGVLGGLLAAAALGGMLRGLLYGISAWTPVVYCVVAALLVLVATAATLVPAWRATQVDPALTLRRE